MPIGQLDYQCCSNYPVGQLKGFLHPSHPRFRFHGDLRKFSKMSGWCFLLPTLASELGNNTGKPCVANVI